jgi:hypothetical protein
MCGKIEIIVGRGFSHDIKRGEERLPFALSHLREPLSRRTTVRFFAAMSL